MKNYGKIVAPLTTLVKENSFAWNKVVDRAFSVLKQAMFTTLILVMPNFTNTFVLECDASRKGLTAVLMQEGIPLAFTSKQLCDKNLGKSTYGKEMMAIIHEIDTCQSYLIG